MQSISHWGQFEIPAAGTENFKDWLSKSEIKPTVFKKYSAGWYDEIRRQAGNTPKYVNG